MPVPSKIGAQVPPLTPGRLMIGVSLPLMGAWITAAVMSNTDLFVGPFFWAFAYMLVVGIWLYLWGVMTTPLSFQRRGDVWGVMFEELAFGVSAFWLFWVFIGN